MQRCIVIADDDPNIIELVKLCLGMAQYQVVATTEAGAVPGMVRSKQPDAVILDVQMPDGGGLPLLMKLKADPKTSRLPVMMLTGERNAETVLRAMEAGADDYMVKPFRPEALLERVSRLLSKPAKAPATDAWEI